MAKPPRSRELCWHIWCANIATNTRVRCVVLCCGVCVCVCACVLCSSCCLFSQFKETGSSIYALVRKLNPFRTEFLHLMFSSPHWSYSLLLKPIPNHKAISANGIQSNQIAFLKQYNGTCTVHSGDAGIRHTQIKLTVIHSEEKGVDVPR